MATPPVTPNSPPPAPEPHTHPPIEDKALQEKLEAENFHMNQEVEKLVQNGDLDGATKKRAEQVAFIKKHHEKNHIEAHPEVTLDPLAPGNL